MDAVGNKKMLNMLILNVLKDYSDSEHRLTQQEIMRILLADYETECDRRSVKNNVLYLKELGYEINMDDGYYLEKRDFENDEIQFLLDAIADSGSKKFTKKKRQELSSKLIKQGNRYFEAKEPVPTITVETKPVEPVNLDEPKLRIRFSAPKEKEEEFSVLFGENFKLMATRKDAIEFTTSGDEESMLTWALRHPEAEVIAPDEFRDKIVSSVQAMNSVYNHKGTSFFKKGIWG